MVLHCVLPACLFLLIAAPAFAQQDSGTAGQPRKVRAPKVIAAEEMDWGSYRQAVPEGSNVALLYGNPDSVAGGPFVMRVKVKDGASAGPQWHTSDLHITVLQGSLTFAEGSIFEEKNAQHLGGRLHPGAARSPVFPGGEDRPPALRVDEAHWTGIPRH